MSPLAAKRVKVHVTGGSESVSAHGSPGARWEVSGPGDRRCSPTRRSTPWGCSCPGSWSAAGDAGMSIYEQMLLDAFRLAVSSFARVIRDRTHNPSGWEPDTLATRLSCPPYIHIYYIYRDDMIYWDMGSRHKNDAGPIHNTKIGYQKLIASELFIIMLIKFHTFAYKLVTCANKMWFVQATLVGPLPWMTTGSVS